MATREMSVKFATAIETILCSKQPKETRHKFRERVGKRHIQFKNAVATNSIFSFQGNRMGKFLDEDDEESRQKATATDRGLLKRGLIKCLYPRRTDEGEKRPL